MIEINSDDEQIKAVRKVLGQLGPAVDEEGHQLRREIAGIICQRVWDLNFSSGKIQCNPKTGDILDHEKRQMAGSMQSAIGHCALTVEIVFDRISKKVVVDILPRNFPGPL